MSVRITSAPETSDRPMQPQTKPPSPRVSKKKDPESRLFTSIILPVCGIPYEPTSTQLPGGPLMWRPQAMVKDAEEYHIFALDAQNPDKTPRMSTHCPPIHILPHPRSDPQDVDDVSMGRADRGSSIAPTGLRRRNGPRRVDVRTPPPRVSRSRTVSSASRLHTAHSDDAPKAEKAEKKGDRRGTGTPDRQTKTQTEAY